jgi:hypothetical protein
MKLHMVDPTQWCIMLEQDFVVRRFVFSSSVKFMWHQAIVSTVSNQIKAQLKIITDLGWHTEINLLVQVAHHLERRFVIGAKV